ncbi:MAG: NADH-dependent dehydrogenase [uncultured Chloroflexi bacterium]|uniref:NADH-dependent dehydrogenase n=1 Tax=uncultured Chloroflexota bacterium TaxID=166587 RepID=A0A6J4K036_9CHLR|nr:MAG: NADH-dependent dehydrogenase [uncultured Chloroflexota bacterium]
MAGNGKNGTLRIGFIGAGGIVRQRHVPGLRQVPNVELAGVVNSSKESTARAAQEYGIKRQFESPEQLIQSDDIDAVWIGTQPYLHSKYTIAALEAGKHVFCQARMAMDYADARRMYDAWKKTNLTATICAPPHYMRGDRVIRRMLNEGFVGKPYNVNVRSYADAYHNPQAPVHWRQIGQISGVNTLDVGMMVEVVHRWLGYTRRVTAHALTLIGERPPAEVNQGQGSTKVERPDTLTVAAEMENGALLSGLWSSVAKFGADGNSIEIYGSDGTIRYQFGMDAPGSGKILAGKASDQALQEVSISDDEARPWTVESDFVEAVRQGKPDPEPSFWDGLKYMEFTEAVAKSAQDGRAVDLPFEKDLRA